MCDIDLPVNRSIELHLNLPAAPQLCKIIAMRSHGIGPLLIVRDDAREHLGRQGTTLIVALEHAAIPGEQREHHTSQRDDEYRNQRIFCKRDTYLILKTAHQNPSLPPNAHF